MMMEAAGGWTPGDESDGVDGGAAVAGVEGSPSGLRRRRGNEE